MSKYIKIIKQYQKNLGRKNCECKATAREAKRKKRSHRHLNNLPNCEEKTAVNWTSPAQTIIMETMLEVKVPRRGTEDHLPPGAQAWMCLITVSSTKNCADGGNIRFIHAAVKIKSRLVDKLCVIVAYFIKDFTQTESNWYKNQHLDPNKTTIYTLSSTCLLDSSRIDL